MRGDRVRQRFQIIAPLQYRHDAPVASVRGEIAEESRHLREIRGLEIQPGQRIGAVAVEGGQVVATIERVHARRVVARREEVPHGALAREAIAALWLRVYQIGEGRSAASARSFSWRRSTRSSS